MIYIETGTTDVYENFGIEYYLASEKVIDEPILLFWRTTPTLMVGRYQNVLEEIDRAYAEANGIHIVRRMSGGGTIYTDLGGWQFSFIDHREAEQIEFQQYIEPVVAALRELGANASFSGRNDLLIDGRKISGNAQYRLPGCVVHHGSLLFDTDLDAMTAATTVNRYKIESKSIKSVRERVANIREHLQENITAEEFKERMLQCLIGSEPKIYTLTAKERKHALELGERYFANWERLYGSGPAYNLEKSAHLAGGSVTVRMEVKRGIIQSAALLGDFFGTLSDEALTQILRGCRCERGEVFARLRNAGVQESIYKVGIEDLADLIAE